MLDANGQLALDKNGKIIQDGNITPIGAPFQSAPGQTFDQNCAVNTIYSANLTPVNSNPNSNGLLPSRNDSNPNDSTRPNIPTIGDSLDGAGVSWKWYSGGWDAAILSYARSKGAYVGATLNGAELNQDHGKTKSLYGHEVAFSQILNGSVHMPDQSAAREFVETVNHAVERASR